MISNWLNRLKTKAQEEFLGKEPPAYSILTDIATNTVLAVSSFAPVIVFLNECTRDTAHKPRANYPNYQDGFFLSEIRAEKYPEWSWVQKDRTFIPTRPDVITDSIRKRSRLAVAKGNLILSIMRGLNMTRSKSNTGVIFQEMIYSAKLLEVKEFKAAGYDESRALEFPYLLQYADLMNIPLRDAADEITLKARISTDEMVKTEFLRLKFFKKIKDVEKIEHLVPIQEEFTRDFYITGTL